MQKLLLVLLLPLLSGCVVEISRNGLKAATHSPIPTNVITRAEVSSIGIIVDQNQATQTPEAVIGYKRGTLTFVPTAVGVPVYAAPTTAGIDVQAGLTPNIHENLSTVSTNASPVLR